MALRTAYSPVGGLELVSRIQVDGAVEFQLHSPIGDYRVQVSFPTKNSPLVRALTWLQPSASLQIPYWPPDLVALGPEGQPGKTRGTIHTHQEGPRSGILYATIDDPGSGALLYLQILTALNDYAIQTHTALCVTVAGEWPEMGFSLPPTEEFGLPAGQEIVLRMPSQLPAEMIAEEPRTGFLNPKLWIPFEDLHDNLDKAGQVGQEVYGAGLAFGLLTRHYFRTLDNGFLIYTNYPLQTMSFADGFLTLSGSGDQRLDCALRIVPVKRKPLPAVQLDCTREGTVESVESGQTKEGHQLFRLKGDCEIAVSWPPSVKKGIPKSKSPEKRPVKDGQDSA